MNGPHVLNSTNVDRVVTRVSPGAYLLGHTRESVRYVGRSDDDVGARIKRHEGAYTYFWFEYATSAKAAFERECVLWHDYGGAQGALDNKNHPARPAGTNWKCPRCSVFG